MDDQKIPQPDLEIRRTLPQPSGCYRRLAIGCAAATLCILLAIAATNILILRHPGAKKLFERAQEIASCQQHMKLIGKALERYEIRHNEYPDKLSDLYPDFLSSKEVLRCPLDKRKNEDGLESYVYIKPAPNASGDTPILICKRHAVIDGSPPPDLILYKNGKIAMSPSIKAQP